MNDKQKHAKEGSRLFGLQSRRRLAELLKITPGQLKLFSSGKDLYKHFEINKATKPRQIDDPRHDLKRVQKRIASLLARIAPPDFLFCPVKGKSHVANAARHRHGRVVHSLDVKKYFPSTPSRRVYWFFATVMQCSPDVAAVLTKIACIEGRLPTGSPLSPIMAYYAHVDVWEAVGRLARDNECQVSIWIDDVTLSGSRVPLELIWRIKQLLRRGGLHYHKEKRSVGRGAEVTGVIIHEDGSLGPANRHRHKRRLLRQENDKAGNRASKSLRGRLAGTEGVFKQIAAENER